MKKHKMSAILDEFDIKILKIEKTVGLPTRIATNLKISNTMVHQRINRLEQGILTGMSIINEKIGYDWGSFTGISLNKDENFYELL
jgi:Lrp/AsnC family transcriptional regulator for asnA, asnC and gidA